MNPPTRVKRSKFAYQITPPDNFERMNPPTGVRRSKLSIQPGQEAIPLGLQLGSLAGQLFEVTLEAGNVCAGLPGVGAIHRMIRGDGIAEGVVVEMLMEDQLLGGKPFVTPHGSDLVVQGEDPLLQTAHAVRIRRRSALPGDGALYDGGPCRDGGSGRRGGLKIR